MPVLHADPSKQTPTPEGQALAGKLTRRRRSPTVSSLPKRATLTTKEAADALGYSPRYIYDLVDEGKLMRASMTGKKRGALRIMASSVKKMLKASK